MENFKEINFYPDGRLDAENAAKYLGISKMTLAVYRSKKTGPSYIKIGKIFYLKRDLDEWLTKNRIVTQNN